MPPNSASEQSPRAIVALQSVVQAARQPTALAHFWAQAVNGTDAAGGSTQGAAPAWFTPDDTPFSIVFEPCDASKTGQNRIHFDLTTASIGDRDRLVEALLANGASHVDIGQSPDEDHVVLADPEGNELCVLAPGNRFLAGCPRLGAVNCDGTAGLGYFWSAALGWPLVWNQDEETAIQAPDGAGPKITWSGTPLMPRYGPERLHFHVTPVGDLATTIEALIELGAGTDTAGRAGNCAGVVTMTDPDGNPFCLVT